MKSYLSIVIVAVLIISGCGASAIPAETAKNTITETITVGDISLQPHHGFITVDFQHATSQLSEPGKPMLPVVNREYIFPAGTVIDAVQVSLGDTEEYQLHETLLPASTPIVVVDSDVAPSAYTPKIDTSVYYGDEQYPEHAYSYRMGTGLYDDERVLYLSVSICPISYRGSQHSLTVYDTVDIQITYTPLSNQLRFDDEYDMLILCPSEYENALQPLVELKNNNNIKTHLVTLENIPQLGLDQQEDIKYFIKQAIETWNITYVLLVGSGVTGEEKFPVRNTWVSTEGYEDFFPSDLYYADIYDSSMGFSTWDANGNQKYGEFPSDNAAVDLYPDVYLGRLPCNTAAEVKSTVNKIIKFTTKNKMTNKIVQIGGDTFPGDPENINEGEYANERVLEKLPGYQTTQLWGSNGKLTKFNIIKSFYSGVDFVDFSGHGSYLSWATHPPGDESRWIPEGRRWGGFTYIESNWVFNFYKLPVVVFNACSCSKFTESPNCLGWSLIQKQIGGAIASYAASGIGYGSYGSSETDRLWGWMEVHIFEGLYNETVLGDVWGNCISEYTSLFISEGEIADYKTVEEMTLFGDPSLAIVSAN